MPTLSLESRGMHCLAITEASEPLPSYRCMALSCSSLNMRACPPRSRHEDNTQRSSGRLARICRCPIALDCKSKMDPARAQELDPRSEIYSDWSLRRRATARASTLSSPVGLVSVALLSALTPADCCRLSLTVSLFFFFFPRSCESL